MRAAEPRRTARAALSTLVAGAVLWGLLGCAEPPPPPPVAPIAPSRLSTAQIADRSNPSIVLVRTPTGLGTGFVVGADGLVATSLHVLSGAPPVSIELTDGQRFEALEVVGMDGTNDVAVVRIAPHDLRPLRLGDASKLHPGDRVVAIGNPAGLGHTVSDGVVSGERELHGKPYIQISAPISHGSSGGPVFNDVGEVIGLADRGEEDAQNIGFATPARFLKRLLEHPKPMPVQGLAKLADLEVTAGCRTGDLAKAHDWLTSALRLKAGSPSEMTEAALAYERATISVVAELHGCTELRREALASFALAASKTDANERRGAMQRGVKRLLYLVDLAL